MLFRQLFDSESSTYTYLLAEARGKEAVIIDPVKSKVPQYIKLIQELNLTLVAAIDTHLHADHITGMGDLAQQLGCQIMMSEHSAASGVTHFLKDGEKVLFGSLKLEVIYTPGHTDDSCCYLVNDKLFTGDTLFIRGTGRTDFQNGSSARQYESIMNKLFQLPEETLVYPGHDYKGMTVSTLFEEKHFNPRLQVSDQAGYIEIMDNLNLPNPKMMAVAVPANQQCGV